MAKKRKISEGQTKFVHLAGDLSQGAAIDRTSTRERVLVPARRIDAGEIVFRVRAGIPEINIVAGDLLIVERRETGHAATGELVVVMVHGRAFIGHWWLKHGERALLDDELAAVTDDEAMEILGAVTLILRWH
jgi:SOS-response transcriptional repressor LexA